MLWIHSTFFPKINFVISSKRNIIYSMSSTTFDLNLISVIDKCIGKELNHHWKSCRIIHLTKIEIDFFSSTKWVWNRIMANKPCDWSRYHFQKVITLGHQLIKACVFEFLQNGNNAICITFARWIDLKCAVRVFVEVVSPWHLWHHHSIWLIQVTPANNNKSVLYKRIQ